MTYLDDLKTRRDAVAAEIAALSTSKAGGLPNASGEGVNVDHQQYKMNLYKELAELEKRIAAAGDIGIHDLYEQP